MAITLSESAALGIEPVKSDNLSFLDSEVLSVDPSKSDTMSVSDAPVLDVDLPQSDTTTIDESNVLSVDKSVAEETVTISEVFSRVATFTRTFSDSYALDDTASPSDELRTDVNINKGNIIGIGDSAPVFTFSTSFADTSTITDSPSIEFITTFADGITLTEVLTSGTGNSFTDGASISETLAHSFGKSLSDSATITESINVVLVSGSSSVLNTSAFNTSVLN
jgi:hypothetical protein